MSNLKEIAERNLLQKQQLPDFFGSDMVRPSYDGLGLTNIPALALKLLGAEGATVPAYNPTMYNSNEISGAFEQLTKQSPINHIVVLLIDALGYDQLENQIKAGKVPSFEQVTQNPHNFYAPITSVYPSTTTTALTSVATARAPQDHGIMGTYNFFPDLGVSVNLIRFAAAFDSSLSISTQHLNQETLVPVPNIFTMLERKGIKTSQINYYAFENSGISRFTSSGSKAKYNGYYTPADAMATIRQSIEQLPVGGKQKSYTYAYISTIDTTAHAYGPLQPNYEAELAAIDFSLKREILSRLQREDVLLIITADHGQIHGPDDRIVWLNDHAALTSALITPVTGESRATYLHLRNGTGVLERTRAYIEAKFKGQVVALTRNEALAAGLFGEPEKEPSQQCLDRVGDLVLCPLDNWQVRQRLKGVDRLSFLVGVHGGLTRAEMLVPFLAMRLNQ
ncbi:MAG: alkaline phosphatase family protein [Chloroflexi bacterium]|uniref:Alkaline phosphatase family protein n=1 Tax=Candidatus Chlorohelix allophototropha TaxID=3003348 RepID=A0A8T7M7D3_9CHLR|nr:alkaline phosphatase family protein [Chloroflexota bacterium]WJW69942.1 alkaline phosphatase family protein [Chloroflexota bacterium L227-S17]